MDLSIWTLQRLLNWLFKTLQLTSQPSGLFLTQRTRALIVGTKQSIIINSMDINFVRTFKTIRVETRRIRKRKRKRKRRRKADKTRSIQIFLKRKRKRRTKRKKKAGVDPNQVLLTRLSMILPKSLF